MLAVTQRGEAMQGSEWALEGMELVIHPVLYEGVRKANGEIGRLWAPAPMELARIDHIRLPHALALGLILPIRWRWALSDEVGYIILTGAKMLEAAGIEVRNQRPGRAWTTLRQSLAALRDGQHRAAQPHGPVRVVDRELHAREGLDLRGHGRAHLGVAARSVGVAQRCEVVLKAPADAAGASGVGKEQLQRGPVP